MGVTPALRPKTKTAVNIGLVVDAAALEIEVIVSELISCWVFRRPFRLRSDLVRAWARLRPAGGSDAPRSRRR